MLTKIMLSLQNFTKNSSHGWGDLFDSDIQSKCCWLTLWHLVDFGIIYLNQTIDMPQSVWV